MQPQNQTDLIRFTRGRVCPVCKGCDDDPRGQGHRCHGFLTSNRIHCSREERAGQCEFNQQSQTYAHRANGPCPCGDQHSPARELPGRGPNEKRKIVRIYRYIDLQGKIAHETIRYEPKAFSQRRPDDSGGCIKKGVFDGIVPILYKLPELCAADTSAPVFILEGEKDVDNVRARGLIATTNPMGSLKWHRVDATPLDRRNCVVIADNDENGRKHAQQVAAERYGKAASIKVLELPGLAEKGDVSDWFAQGGTSEKLLDLAAAAPGWSPVAANGDSPSSNGNGRHPALVNGTINYSILTAAELNIIEASTIKIKPIDWLWHYRLAREEMALVAGEGGLGKSQILLWIASAISRGWEWPDKTGNAPLGTVIIVTAEDAPETTIVPRLRALGADLGKIQIIRAPKVLIKNHGKDLFVRFQTFADLAYWHRTLDIYPDTRLMIVDPIVSYLGKGVNDQRNDEVRSVLEPFLEDVIRPRGVCFLGNTHLNKSMEARNIVHRITGSIAYVNLPRNVHVVFRDPDDPEMRIFGQCKSNNAPDDLKGFQFKITRQLVQMDDAEIETSMPVFSPDLVTLDLKRATDGKGSRGPKPAKSFDDARWLYAQLKNGPVRVRTLVLDAQSAGIVKETDGKIAMSPLYAAKDRIPHAFPGYFVEDDHWDRSLVWKLKKEGADEASDGDKPPF